MKKQRHIKYFSMIALCTCALSLPAKADENRLTQERIRTFYQQSKDVQLKEKEDVLSFIRTHTHEDATFEINMIIHTKGMQTQKQHEILDKKKLLDDTEKSLEIGRVKKIEENVISIDIEKDGRKAKVKDSIYTLSKLRIPSPGGSITTVHVEQTALCDDEVVLTDDNIIQISKSVCNVETTAKPPAE